MKENKLRQLLNENKPTLSTRLWSSWPFYTEVVGDCGHYDYIEFAAEYAPFSQYDLENIARAAELYNMGSMIKVDFQNRGYVAQKAIASGFQAILFTDHRTPDQFRESIRLVKPETPEDQGLFGYPNRRFIGTQNHISQMDHARRLRDIVCCFMIEKAEAMAHIDEICAIPGVDMVQFGPSDYSMSLGKNRQEYLKEWQAAERQMIEVAMKHGVQPRCEIRHFEQAQYYVDLGVRHFSHGDQLGTLKEFWHGEGKSMRDKVDLL